MECLSIPNSNKIQDWKAIANDIVGKTRQLLDEMPPIARPSSGSNAQSYMFGSCGALLGENYFSTEGDDDVSKVEKEAALSSMETTSFFLLLFLQSVTVRTIDPYHTLRIRLALAHASNSITHVRCSSSNLKRRQRTPGRDGLMSRPWCGARRHRQSPALPNCELRPV